MLRIGSVVIRVDDLERQKAFWTAALGYVAREGDDDTFALLHPPVEPQHPAAHPPRPVRR